MTKNQTNFLGIRIEGDINTRSARTAQRPQEELAPYFEALLAFEEIEAIKWRQYTPYFNDGDSCEFSAYGVGVKLVDGDEEAGEEEDGFYEAWGLRHEDKLPVDLRKALKELEEVIGNGAFLDVLLELFGDHAEIIVRRDVIAVDEYSHD